MINCPIGLIAGTAGDASISVPCDTVLWSSSTGDLLISPQAGGRAILTTLITGSGVATITAECTFNGQSQTFNCPVNIIPPDQELMCEISPALAVLFDTCGEKCDCGFITLNFDCQERTLCDIATVTVEVKDCEQPDPEVCPPSTIQQLKANNV